jgi:LysR family glycine cleavage system transcriptional activator
MPDRLPLNAMQAFETAARLGSFATAAGELGVSPAAIGQHIRHLEDHFAKQLFHRRPNGVELTDAGRELFLRLSGAFAELTEAATHLRTSTARPRAVISVISSVGELWLLPQLAELADRSGIQIIEEDADPIDFAARGVDLRITYGATAYPHHAVDTLFHDRMLPVAAPGLPGSADLPDSLLIHTSWGPTYANPQSWVGWFQATGSSRRPDPAKGLSVERLLGAATAARMGLGIALLPQTLAAAEISRGTLVPAGAPAALMPLPYVMISRPAPRRRAGVEPVWRHLVNANPKGT